MDEQLPLDYVGVHALRRKQTANICALEPPLIAKTFKYFHVFSLHQQQQKRKTKDRENEFPREHFEKDMLSFSLCHL